MKKQETAKEDQDPLIGVNHIFSNELLTLLSQRIYQRMDQLCVCVIDHLYICKERMVFRSPGESRESDYRVEEKHDRDIFIWKAHNDPVVSPSGALMIPTEKYLHCHTAPKRLSEVLAPLKFTRQTGDIVHEYLIGYPPKKPPNPPEEGWPVLFRPALSIYSRDSVSVSFQVGNDSAYGFLMEHGPHKIPERNNRYILALARDIRLYLGCSLPLAFEATVKKAGEAIK